MENKIYELLATTQKSYYKKAFIIENENGVFLKSYDTIVCGLVNGEFLRFWNTEEYSENYGRYGYITECGYSNTTLKHINDFRILYGLDYINKKSWLSIPVLYPAGKFIKL